MYLNQGIPFQMYQQILGFELSTMALMSNPSAMTHDVQFQKYSVPNSNSNTVAITIAGLDYVRDENKNIGCWGKEKSVKNGVQHLPVGC